MAAILRLRRGISTPTLLESELFFNTTSETLVVGESTGNHTLVKIGSNTGDVSFIGDVSASNLSLSGNANIVGNITLGGDIYLGDGDNTTDKINVNASLSGSLVPDTDGVYDLGSTSFRYNNIHVLSASVENLNVGDSGILSSSQQITNYNTFLEINGMNVVSGSSQIDLTQTTNYISGIKTRLNTETVISGSSQVDITQTDGYTSFSSSIATTDEGQDVRLDNIETFTASLDTTFEEIASSTHTLVSGSSQIDVNTTQNFQTFSSSVDTRLDEVESTSSINETNITELFSTSSDHESRVDELEVTGSDHETRIDSLESFSSSLDNTFVTETELNTATQSLQDSIDLKLDISTYTPFSTSVDFRLDSLEGDSHTHSNKVQLDVINQDLSNTSNVTFNDITASGNVIVSGDLTVLGTATEIQTSDLYIKDKLITVASGSTNSAEADGSGIEIDGAGKSIIWDDATQSFILNAQVSSSVGFKGDGSELTGVTAADVEYLDVLNKPTLVSGSSQISFNGIIDKPTLFSGSSQVNADTITNFDSNVKDKMNLDNVISGSTQITDGSGLLSSSNENFTQFSSSIDSRVDTLETTFSSSVDSRLDEIETTFSSSVDSRLLAQEIFSESLDTKYLNTDGDSVVSGSSQIDVTQTTNYSSIRQYDNSDNTTHLNSLGVVSGSTYSSPSQGTLRATINGANSDVDLGLQSTDTPTFNSLTASNLPEHATDIYDAVLKGTSGEFGYRTLGNAAFYMVSASISDGNPDVLGNAGAVKDYIDEQLLIIGAGDITKVTAGDGISGGADSGEATITLDTGSQHFIDGVTGIAPTLPDGLVSGSDQVTQSLDTRYVNASGDTVTGDLVISGDLTVNGTTTTINTTNLNVEDNIIELNFGGSATNGGILVKDVTGGSTISGSLLWDGTTDSWIAGTLGSENRILTTADNVITDTNIDTKIKLKLDSDNVHSGSYLGTATTSELTEGTNLYYTDLRVKNKLDSEGVISGSIQVLGGTGILSSSNENFTDFSSSVDSRFGALSTDYNDLQNVPSGIVSSSEQISNYNTFLKINGDNVISSSAQVQIDSVTGFTSFSSSVDSRIDLLESFSTSLDDNFVTETELNTATQSLQDSIDLKLDISTYTPFSTSVDSRLDGLEGITSENPLTFTDTSTIDFTRVGDVITADVIGGVVSGSSQVIGILDSLNSYTSSNDINQTTQNGRLTSLETETGSISTEQSIQDGRLDNLESYTASVDSLYEEISSGTHTLVSGSSQIDVTQTTNYSSINQFSDAKVKLKLDADGVFSSSEQVNADTITNFDSNVLDKINDIGIISGSDQLTGSLVDLVSDQTIGGVKTFDDIVVNGTGSFAYFISTESELNVIGQSFIVLNNDTPTQRYAGLAVYDSGSTGVTASLQFDGQTNDWFYEYSDDGGVTTDHGAVLFGPEYSTKGSPTYPTNNTIQKGNGGHHLLDSNITDDGSTITLGSNTYVNGALSVSGSLLQTSAGNFGITSAGSISLLTSGGGDGVTIAANGDTTIYGKLALQDIPTAGDSTTALVADGSNVVSKRTLGSNAFTSTAIPTNNNQLTNGAGYITGFDITTQTDSKYLRSDTNDTASGIITFSNTTQSTTKTTGAVIVSGGVGIAKTLNVGEDVVAYASSDRRLKDNILPIENPLQKINSIGGYSFDWNVEKQHIYSGKDYGVIAQEIEEILPELVDTRENGYKAVKYDKLVSLLIEGIKELSTEVEQLKQQINK